jgi:hypothetical protein
MNFGIFACFSSYVSSFFHNFLFFFILGKTEINFHEKRPIFIQKHFQPFDLHKNVFIFMAVHRNVKFYLCLFKKYRDNLKWYFIFMVVGILTAILIFLLLCWGLIQKKM